MKKIVKKRQLFNKRLVLNILLVLFLFLSIGYSTLSTNLNINGNLNVKKYYEHTLYNVLAKEAENNGLARKYTGEHHDSFTEEPSKDIYHWYAANNTQGTQVLDKNNVIFAGHCWQMIRTTDTGGVKMVYNGEVENNQCLNTRGNHVGYGSRTTQSLATTYYYGTSYTYDKTNNIFSLDGTITTGSVNQGEYTCKETTDSGTCETLYLVDTLNSGTSYYVIPINSNSHYSQFGSLQFNKAYNSPSYVGYMYNTVYPHSTKGTSLSNVLTVSSMTNETNYYYGTDVTYDVVTNKYTLLGTSQDIWTNIYSSSGGLYTCKSATDTTCSTVYYIAGGVSGSMDGFSMTGGNLLNYYNTNIVLGTDYTESNGTYTLSDSVTITKADWFTNYSTYKNYYTCGNDSTSCSDMKYLTYTNNYRYYFLTLSNNYIYAKDFTYNSGTGTYTLGNDRIQTWNMTDNDRTDLSTHHYTCFNDTGECNTLSYIYYASTPGNSIYIFYINLTGGNGIEDAINEMLSDNSVNQINSIIKTGIDAWYKEYMTAYTSKLEDTIFCNNRSISSLGGWNPDGGVVTTEVSNLQFKNYNINSDLSCTNITDKFSVSNISAQLTYPVGLLTYPESNLLNNSNIRKTGKDWWLGSPCRFDDDASNDIYMRASGTSSFYYSHGSYGVRPSISLKPGTLYSSGDGSMSNPYVVDTSGN